jgi:hypothetical protein
MIHGIRSYSVLEGGRGEAGVDIDLFVVDAKIFLKG